MTPKQFSTLVAAGAIKNLQISSSDGGRLRFRISSSDGGRLRFRVSRNGGSTTLYFRLDDGKFTRAGGCEEQALEVDQLLLNVLDQAGSAARQRAVNAPCCSPFIAASSLSESSP